MLVVFGSIKGGVGKSTLLCNLAVTLQKAGVRFVAVDADPIESTTDWANARAELEHVEPISVITTKPGRGMLKTIRELKDTYDYVLVDLAGVGTEDNLLVIGMADMVVAPFQPSNLDLNTLCTLDSLLRKYQEIRPGLQIRYVLNSLRHNVPKDLSLSREYFAAYDLSPIDAVTYHRKSWRETMGAGLGVLESDDGKAAGEILSVFKELFPHLISEKAHHIY